MTLTDEQAPEPNAPSRQPATPKPYEIEGAIVARLGVALTILLALFLLACGGAGQAVDSSTADANPPAAAVEPTTNGTVPADATPANPEEEDPDLRELLDRTVLNMSELPSLTATTATETRAKGATIRQQQEITAEAPGRAYLLQTGYGGTVEVYLNGTQIYFANPVAIGSPALPKSLASTRIASPRPYRWQQSQPILKCWHRLAKTAKL